MIIQNTKAFCSDGSFVQKDLYISEDRFSQKPKGELLDAQGCYAIPGLIDLHFHGCVGYDFCDGTPEAVQAIARYQAKNGITAICPATMTFPEERLRQVCENAAAFDTAQDGAALVGINMEGPFLSRAKKGAQNGSYLHEPDVQMFRRLQTAANGLIKLVAIAPEEPGAMEMISELSNEVVFSLAHTTADYDTAAEAYRRGAAQATHLYNAMPPFTHRAPGVVGAALDAPHCRAELITDGVHIHPSVVRATFRMFGDRMILISDSMMATGLPDGEYSLGGQAVSVQGNRCTLADGTIAGSATNLFTCMRTAVQQMGIPFADAVRAATETPARALGIFDQRGEIAPGKCADLLLLDESLQLVHVILRGKLLF